MIGRLAFLKEPRTIVMKEFPLPPVEPHGVLARVLRTNVCGSEIHIWKGHHPALKSGVLGHEMVGRVEVMGEGVETDFAGNRIGVGDRIVPAYYITCRRCAPCQRGLFHLCTNAYRFWTLPPEVPPHFHGTFATHYYIHPDQYFYKVPDPLPDQIVASANCALSQVLFGLERVDLRAGEHVLVQGAGGLGLNAVAVAKAKGGEVTVVEGQDNRIKAAEAFGADHIVDFRECRAEGELERRVKELTGGEGVDLVVELTGVPSALSEALRLARLGGRVLSMGNVSPGLTTPFDPGLMTRKGLSIFSYVRYDPWYVGKALAFLAENVDNYPYQSLLDTEFSLDQAGLAIEKSDKREVVRASIIP